MGFSLEPQKEILQERAIMGHRWKVAVCCWFTAKGRTFPKMLKYEDKEGALHTIESIQLLSRDEKNYAGIMAQKYVCSAEIEGVRREFVLIYHPGENTWEMVVN